jgi:hypothetical protein
MTKHMRTTSFSRQSKRLINVTIRSVAMGALMLGLALILIATQGCGSSEHKAAKESQWNSSVDIPTCTLVNGQPVNQPCLDVNGNLITS